MASEADLVLPGDQLGSVRELASGPGTYVDGGQVYAARCGRVQRQQQAASATAPVLPTVSVVRGNEAPLLPAVGDVTTVRVTKVTPRMVVTDIMCVGAKRLSSVFQGIIRSQDVRAMETDKIQMNECFRPGDLVRAEVLALGTMRDYYLTTAKNELGVVWAKSLAGSPMVAVSWQEMRCPATAQVEKRKVAKLEA